MTTWRLSVTLTKKMTDASITPKPDELTRSNIAHSKELGERPKKKWVINF